MLIAAIDNLDAIEQGYHNGDTSLGLLGETSMIKKLVKHGRCTGTLLASGQYTSARGGGGSSPGSQSE